MTIARHIDVTAESETGLDDAIISAIKEAAKTVRGITQFWVKDIQVQVEDNEVTQWRVNGKLSFIVDSGEE